MPYVVAEKLQPLVRTPTRVITLAAAFTVTYVLLDHVSYVYPLFPFSITPWNPSTGLSLALLLLFGLRFAPALFIAALCSDLAIRGLQVPLPYLIISSMLFAVSYAGLAAALIHWVKCDLALASVRDIAWFSGTVIVAALVAALVYVSVFIALAMIPADEFARYVFRLWIGDAIGIVVTTPFIVVLLDMRFRRPSYSLPVAELALQLTSIVVVLWVVFGIQVSSGTNLFYLLFLPLIWTATRHGIEGAVIANLMIQVGLIFALQLAGLRDTTVLEFQFRMLAVAVTGLFLGVTVTGRRRDGARRREMEAQLREQEQELDRTLRLAAAGEMSSSLAHELSQPLSAISNYVHACRAMLADPGAAKRLAETMDKVVKEVDRAGRVVHRLRDFYRSGSVHLESVRVEDLLRRGAELSMQRARREGIAVRLAYPGSLPVVHVDPVQIETVLHNLITNSIDAIRSMPSEHREIVVSAEFVTPDAMQISVTDSGPGIRAEMVDTLFTPFSTSKPQGMGLGLALSRSISEAHGGRLEYVPIDNGAVFRLILPMEIIDRDKHATL